MKVTIISAGRPTFWYVNMIGECFHIKEHNAEFFQVLGDHNVPKLIKKSDCTIHEPNDAAINYVKVDGLQDLIMK